MEEGRPVTFGSAGHVPAARDRRAGIAKAPTGIVGLDQVTSGGLPRGRTTLIAGPAGSGKTLFAVEFLVRGAREHGEPGLLVTFEETPAELAANVASLGFDLDALVAGNLLRLDHVRVDPGELHGAGGYDLDGLFIRLGHAIDAIGARRVALDTIDTLFSRLPDPADLRYELVRLFRWLKERGVTSIVTGERSDAALTRHGLEEFVSDCVIVLDHRVDAEASVRRMRIVKYRGSSHGADEYPFLIDEDGLSVTPLSAAGLTYDVSTERVSTGIVDLDVMLGGDGVFRGSAVLLSGTAGTGKTSIAGSFVDAACRRGERCVFFSFEESASQIVRDLASIGLDLQPWIDADLLTFDSVRPTASGLERHLSRMQGLIETFRPTVVIVDPVTSFNAIADPRSVASIITRLMDVCRTRRITSVFTSLSEGGSPVEATTANISSVADVWLLVKDLEAGGERNRVLYVLKARGLAHSNQMREFVLSDAGIHLVPLYVGEQGMMTGSARARREVHDRLTELSRVHELDRARLDAELHRKRHAAALAALEADFEVEAARSRAKIAEAEAIEAVRASERGDRARRGIGTTTGTDAGDGP